MKNKMNRRKAVRNISLGLGVIPITSLNSMGLGRSYDTERTMVSGGLKGNVHHSVCRWCYQNIPIEKFVKGAKEIGITGIDLLKPEEWSFVKDQGLTCSLATDTFASIANGFNNPVNHKSLQAQYSKLIKQASDAEIKQVIVFSGNRNGISDTVGIENCAKGLAPLIQQAADSNVTLVMELLNSKVDHKDYQCDHTPWGVALAETIDSSSFKLLYDIYHMQIMEGDVIATIRKYNDFISHYHTGGVPGRHEINDAQELNYPAIIQAIVDTGFKGFVAQEFIPTYTDPMVALKEGVLICDV